MGFWDGGADSLKKFQEAHICNTLCSALDLDELDELDIDAAANSAIESTGNIGEDIS